MHPSGFPRLFHGKPDWPSKDDQHLFWVGLHSKFRFAHHPANAHAGVTQPATSYFCEPVHLLDKMVGVLRHSSGGSVLVTGYRGTGKTSLVGACRRPLEERVLEDAIGEGAPRPAGGKRRDHLWWMKVNLSTVSSSHEVLLLTFEALKDQIKRWSDDFKNEGSLSDLDEEGKRLRDAELKKLQEILGNLKRTRDQLRATRFVTQQAPSRGLRSVLEAEDRQQPRAGQESQHTYEREALSRYQTMLVGYIRDIGAIECASKVKRRLVFVFDELDKLQPSSQRFDFSEKREASGPKPEAKLVQLQSIVAELKFFLTESPSHQIFIAGKDVDDSWSEDQNKGEGLFESIFACNIYVPSIFSTPLRPCTFTPSGILEHERHEFYQALAHELGIPPNSWSFNTSLLILPHLAEYETYHLILRAYRHQLGQSAVSRPDKVKLYGWVMACYHELKGDGVKKTGQSHLTTMQEGKVRWPEPPSPDEYERQLNHSSVEALPQKRALAPVMSERTCRRLRILLEYLTYKGRGIPRKILREFHDMVQNVAIVPTNDPGFDKVCANAEKVRATPAMKRMERDYRIDYVLAFEQHHLQKMNFYAGIVEYLDQSIAELRGLNDKGRVSIYHIIDYILKFYSTGFSQRDIEHANFMTTREEFFPSRQLAAVILRVLEGRLWRRKDSRSPEFRLMHNVVHDLSVMFLRYAPEQMELRHTHADFRVELEHLQQMLSDISRTSPEQRLAPVHAQIRMARILDITGKHFEARLSYFKALRWLRMDIHHFERSVDGLGKQGSANSVTVTYITPFVTYAIEVLLALGRLNEEMGEHRNALQLYHEAEEMHRTQQRWLKERRHKDHVGSLQPAPCKAIDGDANREAVALLGTLLDPIHLPASGVRLMAAFSDPNQHSEPSLTAVTMDWTAALVNLSLVLQERGAIKPLLLEDRPAGYVEACNHSAIAYSKLWERASGNVCLLRAIFYLHSIGDEYGVVDQMFFAGQLMMRRRDFHAAALWYVEALKRIAAIRHYSNVSPLQSGAAWQTPAMVTSTEAQILAALGDVWYATGGLAMLTEREIRAAFEGKRADFHDSFKRSRALQQAAIRKLGLVIKSLDLGIYEDRAEEFFHTCARLRFQSIGDHSSANDVYLRQLEFRLDLFKQSVSWFDTAEPETLEDKDLVTLKYAVLNSWTSFWHGARVLLHGNLSAVTALTRDGQSEWGRISDFRRMGVLLRLVGDMLTELAVHSSDSHSLSLLTRQTAANNAATRQRLKDGYPRHSPFYESFISLAPDLNDQRGAVDKSSPLDVGHIASVIKDRQAILNIGNQKGMPKKLIENPSLWPDQLTEGERQGFPFDIIGRRVALNRAARDIRTLFAFISDKSELLGDDYGTDTQTPPDLQRCGFRTLLFRLNGDPSPEDADLMDHHPLPLCHVLSLVNEHLREVGDVHRCFRRLALAEKALISAYLCHRDTIADFNYANTVLSIGELYLSAIYNLGQLCAVEQCPIEPSQLLDVFDKLTEYAKRFLAKTIDSLKREREQNRNTFHLLSVAWFNLGDLMLLRLSMVKQQELPAHDGQPKNPWIVPEKLYGKTASAAMAARWRQLVNGQLDFRPYGDTEHEDLRRQVWESYRQGLVLVQTEMDELTARYRFPADVYYAYGNVMDAVLHFRIARAARVRHSGGRYRAAPKQADGSDSSQAIGFDTKEFKEEWESISLRLSHFESPQRSGSYWDVTMRKLLALVNKVRTDRGPLEPHADTSNRSDIKSLSWIEPKNIHNHPSLDLFEHLTSTFSL